MLSSTCTIAGGVSRNHTHNQGKTLVLGEDVVFPGSLLFSWPALPGINNPPLKRIQKTLKQKQKKKRNSLECEYCSRFLTGFCLHTAEPHFHLRMPLLAFSCVVKYDSADSSDSVLCKHDSCL